LISFVKKKKIFDLVWLHIAWIKFYVRVLEFLNSGHTLHCYLFQFSQFNKTFCRQSLPISSSIKMWCEILNMRVEKKDEPFPIVLCRTACVKHQNFFQIYSFLSLMLVYHVLGLKLGIYAWNMQLKYRMGHEKVAHLPYCTHPCYCTNFCIYAMLRTRATYSLPILYNDVNCITMAYDRSSGGLFVIA
jgi:hypothetical protein